MTTKAIHENGVLRAVKLDCSADEIGFLSSFLQGLLAAENVAAKYELETYVLLECYDRHYKSFSILKARKLKLRTAEFIALDRLIKRVPIQDEYTAILRNTIVGALSSIAWPGRTNQLKSLALNNG